MPSDAGTGTRVDLLLETGGGGSGRHVLDLYAGLRARGWDARLLLSARRMDPGFEAEVALLPPEHITYFDLRRSPHHTDLAAVVRLKRRIASGRGPHLVHAHSTKAAIIGWALGGVRVPRLLTPHAYRGMDPKLTGMRGAVVRRAERVFTRGFDEVIAVSEDERAYAVSLGVDAARVHYVPNGVDVAKVRSVADAVRGRREPRGPVLGFVGRLVPQKNPALFVEVLGEVVRRGLDARAIIVGDGPLLGSLKELAAQMRVGERIEWLGTQPALDELGRMDVMVHTSLYESLPYSILEAVAANVPVVAVENAGSRAIFGELFPRSIVAEGTAALLADEVQRVLESGTTRRDYVSHYTAIATRFSSETMVDETIAVYRTALSGQGVTLR